MAIEDSTLREYEDLIIIALSKTSLGDLILDLSKAPDLDYNFIISVFKKYYIPNAEAYLTEIRAKTCIKIGISVRKETKSSESMTSAIYLSFLGIVFELILKALSYKEGRYTLSSV